MLKVFTALFGLAETVLKHVSEKKRTEFRDTLYRLKQDILSEESKPVAEQDDAKLELLHKQIPLVVEAITIDIQLGTSIKKE